MLATLRSLEMNLSNLTFFCDYLTTSFLPPIRSYFECIDMRRPIHPRLATRPLQRNAAGFDMKGENITFHYPHQPNTGEDVKYSTTGSQSKPALQEMSFHFEAGKMHALVGDNGCGKTTLVQLMSQLYTNFSGRITLNGHNIKDYDINEIRSHVSVMFQDIAKLQRFSVFENIGIGDVNALAMNQGAIETVAAEHKVTDFISLNTVIGDLHQVHRDPGEKWQAELSGGQWQKIALARTFLKGHDADLIILDEPTSALDVHAEHEFFQQLKTLRKGKTTIFITHKYVTTATADCIHFMKKGKIVERGNHAELMASNGEYASRYTLQTQGYTETGVGESV
jgi:ATP-binding cassette, subfamily B, bacterial